MDRKIKCWLLLVISKAPKKRGVSLVDLHQNRPDFLEDSLPDLITLLNELQKELLINQIHGSPAYIITEKGQKELRKLYYALENDELEEIMKCFPEIKLSQRIKNIETFIFYIVLFISMYVLLTLNIIINPWLRNAAGFALFLSAVFGTFSFALLSQTFIKNLQLSFLNTLFDFMEDNKRRLGYLLMLVLSIIGLIILSKPPFSMTIVQIMQMAILEAIVLLLSNAAKINNLIKTKSFLRKSQ